MNTHSPRKSPTPMLQSYLALLQASVERPVRVVLLYGGPAAEHDISKWSAKCVASALSSVPEIELMSLRVGRCRRWALDVAPETAEVGDSEWCSPGAGLYALEQRQPHVVLSTMHGPFGEDGVMQGALEALGIPLVGSGVFASALAMQKDAAKTVLAAAGVPVAIGTTVAQADWNANPERCVAQVLERVGLPCFVKPAKGGSSVGAGPAQTARELSERLAAAVGHRDNALVEPLLVGREFTAPVVEQPSNGEPEALPLVEIRPIGHAFFDYESKYTDGHNEEICPAPLDAETTASLKALGLAAHRALGCQDLSRTDILLTASGPVVLEVNTLPGMTDASLITKAAAARGWTFQELLVGLLISALRRGRREI